MQVEQKTEKGTVLFVKVPDDAYNFKCFESDYFYMSDMDKSFKQPKEFYRSLPLGNWQLIGLTSEVTEDQANMMVDADHPSYGSNGEFTEQWSSDSFKSLMKYLKIYEVNPYPKNFIDKLTGENRIRIDWEQAQSRTGKFIVLFKPHKL